jgi:hypothetical protein
LDPPWVEKAFCEALGELNLLPDPVFRTFVGLGLPFETLITPRGFLQL